MTARELAMQILALPEDQQAMPVYRSDCDYGPVPVKEIEIIDLHTWSDGGDPCEDYMPEYDDGDGETKWKGIRIR